MDIERITIVCLNILPPDNEDALALKGLSLSMKKDFRSAIGCYQKAIAKNSNLAMAYSNLGGAHREVGELVESEAIIRKGLEVEPKNFYLHYELAQTLA